MLLRNIDPRRLLPVLLVVLLGVNSIVRAETPDFKLKDIHGQEHNLSDYRGKWVIVNYWATWCPPCLEEIPELDALHDARKDVDAVVLGVNMENISPEELRAFAEEQFIDYPILVDKPRRSTELGAIPGMPTTYVITPEGEIVARQVGGVTRKMIDDFLDKEIKKRADQARR